MYTPPPLFFTCLFFDFVYDVFLLAYVSIFMVRLVLLLCFGLWILTYHRKTFSTPGVEEFTVFSSNNSMALLSTCKCLISLDRILGQS